MSQQINLLDDLPKSPRLFLSNRLIFLMMAGYVAFLLMVIVLQLMVLGWGKYSLVQLQKSYVQHQVILNQNTQLASVNNTGNLESQLSEKQALLETLESRKATTGQCGMLSYYLEKISQSIVPGVWLIHIDIDLTRDLMALSGNTYSSGLLMQFIDIVQKNPCFQDRQYGPIEITRSSPEETAVTKGEVVKKDDEYFGFTVKSTAGDALWNERYHERHHENS